MPCIKNVLVAPEIFSLGGIAFFAFHFPEWPFSGLVGEADYPTFLFLTWMSQLESALVICLEGVCPSYTCSEILICSNMAHVSLKALI